MDKDNKFNIDIQTTVCTYNELSELVATVDKIQKEHSCNCTLSVKIGVVC